MGFFSKRTTENQWLTEFSPLVKQYSELKEQTLDILDSLSTEISPMSQHLPKVKSLAQQIKRLPAPASSAAARAKSGYDSWLEAVIDDFQVSAQVKVFVNMHRQQSKTNLRLLQPSSLTSSELNKAEKMGDEKVRLERRIFDLEKERVFRSYFREKGLPFY